MSKRHLARAIIMQVLYQWDFKGKPTSAIPAIIEQNMTEFGMELEDTKESDRTYDLDRTMESDLVNNALSLLPERKRGVMQLRYGIGGIKPHTFEEIGHIMGISKQAVSQIHYNLTTEFAFLVNLARVGRAYRQSIR